MSFLPILVNQYRLPLSDSVTWLEGDHVAKPDVESNNAGMGQVFRGNRRDVFAVAAAGGRAADEAGCCDENQREAAVFLQDQWYPGSKVTVSPGLRYEYRDNPNSPVLDRDEQLDPAIGIVQPDARMPDAKNQLSPRHSFSRGGRRRRRLDGTGARLGARGSYPPEA